MDKREKIISLAESAAHTVYAHHVTDIDTNNGALNEGKLDKERTRIFSQAVIYLKDTFMTEIQYYPVNDISEVVMDIDFVAIKRDHWKEILKYLDTHE